MSRSRPSVTTSASTIENALAESIVPLLCDLIRIPSVNPSIAPDETPGAERACAEFARSWLEANGVKAWLEEAAPGRPNVVGEVPAAARAAHGGSGSGRAAARGGAVPTLVFCAHLDTVGTAGMTIPPFTPTVSDGRVYGRGAYDMKGGVAACMAAAAALAKKPALARVLLALVADEEYESIGASDFVRRHEADGCILTEPSEGRLILAHKGFAWLEISTRGRAAHGSRFDIGVSAIARMGRVIAALDRFDCDTLRARKDPLVGAASMHCALVQGGAGLSTYAPDCVLSVERRTLPGETAEQVAEEIRSVIRDSGESAEVRVKTSRSPLSTPPDSALVRAVRDAATAVTGAPPEEAGVAFWMDAAIFGEAGIPAVNYGPSGEGAHEAVEWVDVRSVVATAEVLVESARRICS